MSLHPMITASMIEKAAIAIHEDIEASLTIHTRRQDRWQDLSVLAKLSIRRSAAAALNAAMPEIEELLGRSMR